MLHYALMCATMCDKAKESIVKKFLELGKKIPICNGIIVSRDFILFFQFCNTRNLANYSQKIVKLTQEKTKVSTFCLKKRQKFVGNEALIVSTNLLRNVENLSSCSPRAR
jgi:hypothetical protein